VDHIVDKDAADTATRCLWNVEYLDSRLGRPNWRQLDREPLRNGPAIENKKVQGEHRERVCSGIGDHEIGAATAALLLKLVEFDANRFWRFSSTRQRPAEERESKGPSCAAGGTP
jgi:hypothetical protein